MSSGLYEFLVVAARYLFAFLALLLLIRAFLWLRSENGNAGSRERKDVVGELIVLTGNRDCPEGISFPVPTEGFLGSVRSCDIAIPDREIRKHHCFFSHDERHGLLLFPQSGCEIRVDSALWDCRSGSHGVPLPPGSLLLLGNVLLQYQSTDASAMPVPLPYPRPVPPAADQPFIPDPVYYRPDTPYALPPDPSCDYDRTPEYQPPESLPGDYHLPEYPPVPGQPDILPESTSPAGSSSVINPSSRRKRRAERWEEDWSE